MSYAINSAELEDQTFEIQKKVVGQNVTEKNYFTKNEMETEVNDFVSNLHGFIDSNYI